VSTSSSSSTTTHSRPRASHISRIKNRPLPTFKGTESEDAILFLEQFERFGRVHDFSSWPETEKVDLFLDALGGKAAKWAHLTLSSIGDGQNYYSVLVNLFKQRFIRRNRAEKAREALRSMKIEWPGRETLESYYDRVLMECTNYDPHMSERAKLDFFRDGLPNELKTLIRLKGCRTMLEALEEAEILVAENPSLRKPSNRTQETDKSSVHNPDRTQQARDQLPSRGTSSSFTCYRCNQRGHAIAQCPYPPAAMRSSSADGSKNL
jgi:hypothetical protein